MERDPKTALELRREEKERKRKERINSTLIALGEIRGPITEEDFLSAMSTVPERRKIKYPPWLFAIRKALPHEDFEEGTDAIAITDIGKIRIQIKSSHLHVQLFEKRTWMYTGNIVVLEIKRDESINQIRTKTFEALRLMRREHFLRKEYELEHYRY